VEAAPDDVDARLRRRAERRGHSPNLSYFAFTATPKHKTLELFGSLDATRTYRPFHTYSMRQAIEEGFILDPLCNYLTYATYWKLVNQNPDDRQVDPAKANPLLARFAITHDATVAQHAQVIVEHFFAHTRGRLGGRAKAMVVTASRHSAVQLGRALKRYLAERGYPDPGVLVAFSGTLAYEGEETTESRENGGLPESRLAEAFGYCRADDRAVRAGGPGRAEYRILVVAEKYQTGFDQPLLTTMYVVKTLLGVAAVQTLSRINRTAERKSQADLAVLDFVNQADDIQQAFRPFYEQATTLPSDPNLLYNAQGRVMSAAILAPAEIREFAAAYLAAEQAAAGSEAAWRKLHAELYRLLDPAIGRYTELADSAEEQDRQTTETFRGDLQDYVRKYGFLSQIVPYQDPDLEALYLYGRHLLNRLPRRNDGGVDIGEIDLSHLRVEKTGQHDLSLTGEGPGLTKGFGDGSGSGKEPEKSLLSELIERFNQRHGTSFTERDVLPAYNEAIAVPKVRLAAVANDEEGFGLVFDPVFEEKMADHIDTTASLGEEYFRHGSDLRNSLNRSARAAAWRMIRQQEGLLDSAA
jgi:type I restriction enzyme R subunit